MNRDITIALTETISVFPGMPARPDGLDALAGRLEDVRSANVAHNLALIERAAARGAQIVGLGELFTAPYFALTRHPVWLELAEDAATGPTVTALAASAARLGVAIVAPIYERDPESGRRFNTAVVLDRRGKIVGKYRKTHIPEGKNEQGAFNEPFYFGPARDVAEYFPVFDLGFVRIGVSICYDRHFDGVVRSLAAGGAELIFSPAVTFGAKSERMWAIEFEVDAARNNVFIAGSNRKGAEPPWNQPFFGGSLVVGPNGRVPVDRSEEALVVATVDLAELTRPDPSGWNLARDRRPDIYLR